MFLVKFCCANSRDNQDAQGKSKVRILLDPNSSEIIEVKLRRASNVLEGYKRFEDGLGMYKVDIAKLMEMILGINTENNEVPKKDL